MSKLVWSTLLVLTLRGSTVHAAPIATEKGELLVHKLTDLGFTCRPGVAPNGHNFPTPSGFSVSNLDFIIPSAAGMAVGINDPKGRVGDHCAELTREVASVLPAKLVLVRTVRERFERYSGVCLRSYVAELTAKLGPYELSGSSSFIIDKADDHACS